MTKFLSLFLKVLITLPVVGFLFFVTLSNRDANLNVVWSPFTEAVMVSLPLVIFAGLVLGFVWGSLILWSNTLEMRAERRVLKKRVAELENQIVLQRHEYDRQIKTAKALLDVPPPTPRIAAPEIL